jgi:hypothetical protein
VINESPETVLSLKFPLKAVATIHLALGGQTPIDDRFSFGTFFW